MREDEDRAGIEDDGRVLPLEAGRGQLGRAARGRDCRGSARARPARSRVPARSGDRARHRDGRRRRGRSACRRPERRPASARAARGPCARRRRPAGRRPPARSAPASRGNVPGSELGLPQIARRRPERSLLARLGADHPDDLPRYDGRRHVTADVAIYHLPPEPGRVRPCRVEAGAFEPDAKLELIDGDLHTVLGLRDFGTRTVVYADERREQRPVTDVTIEIGNLATRTEAIVGPAGSQVLIGQVVLKTLDLIADCRKRNADASPSGGACPGHSSTATTWSARRRTRGSHEPHDSHAVDVDELGRPGGGPRRGDPGGYSCGIGRFRPRIVHTRAA